MRLGSIKEPKAGSVAQAAVLQGSVKLKACGDTIKRNIGFHSTPNEFACFGAVLKKSAKVLTDADIAALVASLGEKPKAASGEKAK